MRGAPAAFLGPLVVGWWAAIGLNVVSGSRTSAFTWAFGAFLMAMLVARACMIRRGGRLS